MLGEHQRSIGIALTGTGAYFTTNQYSSLSFIIVLLIKILGIKEENIIGYEDISAFSFCPGQNFDWSLILNSVPSFRANPIKQKVFLFPSGYALEKNIYGCGK